MSKSTGVAIWSPLDPVLVNIFMCQFEESWLANNQFRPFIWFIDTWMTRSLYLTVKTPPVLDF